jgi:hypothetical protein
LQPAAQLRVFRTTNCRTDFISGSFLKSCLSSLAPCLELFWWAWLPARSGTSWGWKMLLGSSACSSKHGMSPELPQIVWGCFIRRIQFWRCGCFHRRGQWTYFSLSQSSPTVKPADTSVVLTLKYINHWRQPRPRLRYDIISYDIISYEIISYDMILYDITW